MSDTAPEADDRRRQAPAARRPGQRLFEIVIGGGVLLISLVSLFVAVNANRTQERILAASVWPSLVFGTSDAAADGSPQVSLDLLNRGTGPARVRWAELQYRGVPMANAQALLASCCGYDGAQPIELYTSSIQRRVLGADEWVQLLRMPRPAGGSALYEALPELDGNLRLRLCYCSVLDDCWLLDSGADDDPTPLRACPAPPAVLWRH